jgi:hypothetical protein
MAGANVELEGRLTYLFTLPKVMELRGEVQQPIAGCLFERIATQLSVWNIISRSVPMVSGNAVAGLIV